MVVREQAYSVAPRSQGAGAMRGRGRYASAGTTRAVVSTIPSNRRQRNLDRERPLPRHEPRRDPRAPVLARRHRDLVRTRRIDARRDRAPCRPPPSPRIAAAPPGALARSSRWAISAISPVVSTRDAMSCDRTISISTSTPTRARPSRATSAAATSSLCVIDPAMPGGTTGAPRSSLGTSICARPTRPRASRMAVRPAGPGAPAQGRHGRRAGALFRRQRLDERVQPGAHGGDADADARAVLERQFERDVGGHAVLIVPRDGPWYESAHVRTSTP